MPNSRSNLGEGTILSRNLYDLRVGGEVSGGSVAALGTVRIQVMLFESGRCPFSKRVRQVHEFLFTKNNIQFLNASQIDDVETIDMGSSVGVTLKRAQYGRFSTCFAERVFVSSSDQANPSIDVEGINEIAASVRSDNESLFMHQLFIHAPGLFTNLINKQSVEELSRSSYQQGENARSPLEDLIPVSRTRSVTEPPKKSQNRMPGEEVSVSADQPLASELPYVQLDTSFVGNLFEKLGEGIRTSWMFLRDQRPAQKIGDIQRNTVPTSSTYSNLNPGMHVSYEKVTDLFAGLDFSFKFHNTTPQFPKVSLDTVKTDGGSTEKVVTGAFLMRHDYCYLDPLYIDYDDTDGNTTHSVSTSPSIVADNTISDAATVERNFGVARPVYRTATTITSSSESSTIPPGFIIPADAEKNYLAEQPYIIIEVDGGKENRFFICITHESKVSVYEVTEDPEWVSALTTGSQQTTTVLRGGKEHSRLLATMNKSGASVLTMDAFEISVQHYFGRLQISIDGNEPLVIERNRWPDHIRAMAMKQMLTESQLQALDAENKPASNQYFSPIKLSGVIRVHMGNYRGAFNFSPLQYVPSVSLTTQFPVTAHDVAYPPSETSSEQSFPPPSVLDKSAISILLRSKGSRDATKNAEDIENGTAVGFAGEEPSYWFQSCLELKEVIGSNEKSFTSDKFSTDVRKTIPGDTHGVTSSHASSYAGFQVSSPSVIQASYKGSVNTNNPTSINITPSITLKSGSLELLGGDKSYIIENCLRPLCTSFTVFIKEDESDRWTSEPIDITNHVISFEDTWTREERHKINHQGSMTLYLTKGEAQGNFESIKPVSVTGQQYPVNSGVGGQNTNDSQADKSDYLASLQDRYFYVTVYAWRDGAGYFDGSMYVTPASGAVQKSRQALFTGICNDVSFQTEPTKIIMTCNLRDYSMVLEHMRWLNAPYYDAMRDYNAVLDVICQAGFKLGGGNSSSENGNDSASAGTSASSGASLTNPGRLIKELASIKPQSDYRVVQFGDEQVIWNDTVLPGKYATLNSPMFKPAVSDPYMSILVRIAKMMGKTMFFDANGVFHFDVPVDEAEMQQVDRATQRAQGFPQIMPVDYFSWSPNDTKLIFGSGVPSTINQASAEVPSDIPGASGGSPDSFNAPIVGSNAYKWWNVVSGSSYSFKRLTKDVVNEIRLISSTPDMSKMIAGHLNKNSIVDPASPSFIGYKKMFFQSQSVFGSKDTLEGQLSRYSKMFNAPVEITFTVPGRTGLRPMQVIEFNGFGSAGPIRLLIGEVKNNLTAADNKWETTITGLYFIPGETVRLNETARWQVNRDGSVSDETGDNVV